MERQQLETDVNVWTHRERRGSQTVTRYADAV